MSMSKRSMTLGLVVLSLRQAAALILHLADLLEKRLVLSSPPQVNLQRQPSSDGNPPLQLYDKLRVSNEEEEELMVADDLHCCEEVQLLINETTATTSDSDGSLTELTSLDHLQQTLQHSDESSFRSAAAASAPDRCRSNSLTSDLGEDLADDLCELDPSTGLAFISLEEVAEHCTPWDAWTVVYDKVYDLTDYMQRHPGGAEVVMEYVGYDATIAFRGVGHSRAAFRILEKFVVGVLPHHQRLNYDPDC